MMMAVKELMIGKVVGLGVVTSSLDVIGFLVGRAAQMKPDPNDLEARKKWYASRDLRTTARTLLAAAYRRDETQNREANAFPFVSDACGRDEPHCLGPKKSAMWYESCDLRTTSERSLNDPRTTLERPPNEPERLPNDWGRTLNDPIGQDFHVNYYDGRLLKGMYRFGCCRI